MNEKSIHQDFPIFREYINNKPLIYLDSASTTQMPTFVLEKINYFYKKQNANVHRGVNTLSYLTTKDYEHTRKNICKFINANNTSEILFTNGATDSLNFVARSYGDLFIKEGDEIVISIMEHHSNIIPWQQLVARKKAILKYINITKDGYLDMEDARKKITRKTKIVSLTHSSNVLGVITPIEEIASLIHKYDGVIVVDGSQAIPHISIDIKKLGVDFYAFSGHKMCGPTGVGILYGKQEFLEKMLPINFGGEMIENVDLQKSTWKELPWKFEAGTPNISGVIGLGAAIDYLKSIGLSNINRYEKELIQYAFPKLKKIKGISIYGPQCEEDHTSVISFNLKKIHPHDISTFLDMQGIEVRAGHHCAQPLMNRLSINGSVRASFYFYNTKKDIDKLIESIEAAKEYFTYVS